MLFTSPVFLFYFLPIFLIIFRFSTSWGVHLRLSSKIILIFSTYVFYGFENTAYLFPFLFATLMDYFWGRRLVNSEKVGLRKTIVLLSVIQNLSLFFIFKYLNWIHGEFPNVKFLSSLHSVFKDSNGLIALPPGISFYLFESLSYVIDLYRREVACAKNPIDFLVFISMFPRFIAGPIVRFSDLKSHIDVYKNKEWLSGIYVFCVGFIIKVLFADHFGEVTDSLWGKEYSVIASTTALFSYTMQLYLDFSGYSLMAIGLGKAIGFPFLDNFREPYHARSITDFWRRWHISLSSWLRDYLYIPLGGSRVGKYRAHLNLFITMVVGGIWHGANITFVIWGIWHGLLLILDKLFGDKIFGHWFVFCRKPITFLLVMMGWLPFRAVNFFQVKAVFFSLLGRNGLGGSLPREVFALNPVLWFFLILGFTWVFFAEPKVREFRQNKSWAELSIENVRSGPMVLVTAAFVLALTVVFSKTAVPFLYFQF